MIKTVTLDAIHTDYERFVHDYERRWSTFLEFPRRWIIDHLQASKPDHANILDLGCGTGQMLSLMLQRYQNIRITGVDGYKSFLKQAQERVPNGLFYGADLESYVPSENSYDVALSLFVLHHLNNPDRHIQSLIKAVKPGGVVVLADFAVDGLVMKCMEHWWRLSLKSHKKAFSTKALRRKISHYSASIQNEVVLKPDYFWRQQIYILNVT